MKRRLSREYVLQFLFQNDFSDKKEAKNSMNQFFSDKQEDTEIIKFAKKIINGTLEKQDEIDDLIKKTTEHWIPDRIAVVDKNIMRSAIYELLFCDDIPAAVTINEAIEIAKKYSTFESASFINGILDKIAKKTKKNKAE
ncbi:MAG: transcription antitermination factor NusB [Nitrospiraceae bacterium]|nr:transcription antitermination factor NusB [Nitrospiraceae bacterium]